MNLNFIDNNQNVSLLSDEFLATLLEQKERIIYARITALNIQEQPIDAIEGKVTGGSINIDGASSVRRTCNLTMISDEIDINDFYWGIKTKFKLEIGVKNNLFKDTLVLDQYYNFKEGLYPEIVWFPEGIFVITNFNTSISSNNCTISLSGKDKMSLLNGDLGGQLFASIDFGQEEYKNSIMVEASVEANNSDILMSNSYYIKDFDELPDKIFSYDEKYILVQDPSGLYYKNGNIYLKAIVTLNQQGEITSFKTVQGNDYIGSRYTPYKKVLQPSDLFTLVVDLPAQIEKNKYYFSKQPNYYVLNRTTAPVGTGNYQLKTLYTLDYEYTITKIPLEKIIKESVHNYAKEPYHNIIINDLDSYGLEQLTYKGDEPLLIFRNASGNFTQMMLLKNFKPIYNDYTFTLKKDKNNYKFIYVDNQNIYHYIPFSPDTLVSDLIDNTGKTKIYANKHDHSWHLDNIYTSSNSDNPDEEYTIALMEYGSDIGYRLTDLTYTGELISSIGDSLVTVLDKIKAMLGDFEYFYDVNGHFVFQRKKTYVNTSWSQLTKTEGESYVDYVNSDHNKFSFNFEGNRLLTAIQNAPVLNNLKNDFIVWGKRKSLSGVEIPIHARYAIDKKPQFYQSLSGKIYITDEWLSHNQDSPILQEQNIDPQTTLTFQKEPVPRCLWKDEEGNSDWWEVSNWGRWYELQIGAPPSGRMMSYQTGEEGFKGIIHFDNTNEILNCNVRKGQLMLDLQVTVGTVNGQEVYYGKPYVGAKVPAEVDEDGKVIKKASYYGSFDQHKWGGCGHNFLLVLKVNAANPGMKSYIYKPVLPDLQTQQEDLEHKDENPITTPEIDQKKIYLVDWRELIYQMAVDQHAGQGCSVDSPVYDMNGEIVIDDPDHLLYAIASRNQDYYPTGYTGYEQYYTDMLGFWRELYDPEYIPKEQWSIGQYKNQQNFNDSNSMYYSVTKTWQNSYIEDYQIDYYTSLSNLEIQQQYNNLLARYQQASSEEEQEIIFEQGCKYCKYCIQDISMPQNDDDEVFHFEQEQSKKFWNINVFENPELLNFWIDFLDSPSELAEFSIPVVGDRTKVINEDKANSLIFKEIPDIVLYDTFNHDKTGPDIKSLKEQIQEQSGYTFVYLPKGFSELLAISYRNLSVKDKIDELLYNYAYCVENITITSLPIYHLQPNTRIYVQDKITNINGEYIVNKITIPLTFNGTMSISANKAPERFY